jgi:hypothetical protein
VNTWKNKMESVQILKEKKNRFTITEFPVHNESSKEKKE